MGVPGPGGGPGGPAFSPGGANWMGGGQGFFPPFFPPFFPNFFNFTAVIVRITSGTTTRFFLVQVIDGFAFNTEITANLATQLQAAGVALTIINL